MKTLHLNLKKEWFDLISSGVKKEEYREIKQYWSDRFVAFMWCNEMDFTSFVEKIQNGNYQKISWMDDFETVTFSNGYSKTRRQMVVEFKGFCVKEGNTEWGAKEGEKYFCLSLGDILTKNF